MTSWLSHPQIRGPYCKGIPCGNDLPVGLFPKFGGGTQVTSWLGHLQNLRDPRDIPIGLSSKSLGFLLQNHPMGKCPPGWVICKIWGNK